MAERVYKTKPLYVVETHEIGEDLVAFEERITALMLKGWVLHGGPIIAAESRVFTNGCIYHIYQALKRPDTEIELRAIWGK